MGATRILSLVVLTFLFSVIVSGQKVSEKETLRVTEQGEMYILTVPVSHLAMTIPKSALARLEPSHHESTDNPRYFIFEDEAVHFIISGWFENADHFSSVEKLWAKDLAAWKQRNLAEPLNVSFEDVGSWKTIFYDTTAPANGQSHLRAHLVQAGTWIELHLSFTSSSESQAQRRTRLREALKGIQVSERK